MAETESMIPKVSATADPIRIAPVAKLEDFERCVQVQFAVWGYSDGDLVPKRVFIVASKIGGQVIGAFDRDLLIGFAMALPGYRGGQSYLHSHMLAVMPEYRNAGLGRRLKIAQRDDALARGLIRMEWTFDPLEIKNAHLNIVKLGAIVRRYLPDFYGPSTSPLQGGLPTDRLVAEWWLKSERVARALHNGRGANTQPVQIEGIVHVPGEVYEWKRDPNRRKLAQELQRENRHKLESAFARGLAVIGFERAPNGDGSYLLGYPSGLDESTR